MSNNIIKTFENFLSAEECDFILNKCKTELTLTSAEVYVDNFGNRYDKATRKSSIGWVSDLGFLNERLTNKLIETFDINGMEVTGLGPFQFTQYKEGDEYNWHTDGDKTLHRDRFASIVIQLNGGYDGGILQIKNIKRELVSIENKIGTLYIFDSRLLHRVTPVETGVRYSLVNWVSLVKINSKKTKYNMKNVIVIGGGTAGWLTALSVNKFWKDASVTLIESSKIGILGAGEGGTPNFGAFLTMLQINQNDFYKRTGCTSKTGLVLTNWRGDNKSASHLFTGPRPTEYKQNYAYHFDARMVAAYLKEVSLLRGVKWIDGEVDSVSKTGDDIHSISLKEGIDIKDVDFVFDCSGFAKVIIGKVHNEEWIDYSKYLLLNRAMAYFLPQENQYSIGDVTHTNMISMNSGWMWQIPLQHRWGCGYSFNSEFITVEEAKKEVEDYIGKEITIQKVFDFKPGTHKRSWIGNSVAVGLSYGFIEPLEATSLMSTIMQLKKLISAEFDLSYRDRFNDFCASVNEQNMMFVRYHYLAERFDTPFWKASYEMPIPKKLQLILDENNNPIPKTNAELLKTFDLKEVEETELTFFIYNYQMIYKKNKKVLHKELI